MSQLDKIVANINREWKEDIAAKGIKRIETKKEISEIRQEELMKKIDKLEEKFMKKIEDDAKTKKMMMKTIEDLKNNGQNEKFSVSKSTNKKLNGKRKN